MSQFSQELLEVESLVLVKVCRRSDYIVGLRLRLIVGLRLRLIFFILIFYIHFSFFPHFCMFTLKICVRAFPGRSSIGVRILGLGNMWMMYSVIENLALCS